MMLVAPSSPALSRGGGSCEEMRFPNYNTSGECSTPQHESPMAMYRVGRVLGKGYFGKVREAHHKLTQMRVAVKTLRRHQFESIGMAFPPREIDLLRRIPPHFNVCQVYDVVDTGDRIFLIQELVDGGELFEHCAQVDRVPEESARSMWRDLVTGVAHLHRNGVVHRDLKLENCLLTCDGRIKVIDMGLGNFTTLDEPLATFCGTPDYAAPELWHKRQYFGPPVDIWALGVILYCMLTGFVPFEDSQAVISADYQWPDFVHVSEPVKDLVGRIFVLDPHDRASMEELLAHPWTTANGTLPSLLDALEVPPPQVDERVLHDIEALTGFTASLVRSSVVENELNVYSCTYKLLKARLDAEDAFSSSSPQSSDMSGASPMRWRRGSESDTLESDTTTGEVSIMASSPDTSPAAVRSRRNRKKLAHSHPGLRDDGTPGNKRGFLSWLMNLRRRNKA